MVLGLGQPLSACLPYGSPAVYFFLLPFTFFFSMSEFEDTWELTLAEAMRRAQTEGRADIAGYLDLRAQNDLLPPPATDWFTTTFTSLAPVAHPHLPLTHFHPQHPP